MISEASPTDESVAAEVHAVCQAGYACEAALLKCPNFPPLRESVVELRQSANRFLVAREGGAVVGVLSFFCDGECARITRLVVTPSRQRQGIATALLGEFERRLDSVNRFAVCTAKDNAPALRLYERFGYAVTFTTTSPEGIALVHMAKLQRTTTR